MKFIIQKKEITDVLSSLQGLAGRKTSLAITENVLIKASDDAVIISATDLETGFEGVYPAEVERVLKAHPEIEDIAVVGISDETWGEIGHAFVIRKSDSSLQAEQIIAYCKEQLAGFKCPREFTFCEEFPRTSLGKVKKRELVQLVK